MTREQVLEILDNGIFIKSNEHQLIWKGIYYHFGKTTIVLDDDYLHCLFYQGNQLTSTCNIYYPNIEYISIKKSTEKNAVVFISQDVHYICK